MKLKKETGFSLIELLIVVAMLSLVMAAVYSLYLTHQKTAFTQDEVVEVQQNLRIAMDSMTHDIKMAGFLIPATNTPVGVVSSNAGPAMTPAGAIILNTSDGVTLNTASGAKTYAWIDIDASATTGLGTIQMDSSESVDQFISGDVVVARIIRPQDKSQPGGAANTFIVSNPDRAAKTMTLSVGTGVDPGPVFKKGDVIARTTAAAPHPNTVAYSLGQGGTCPANQVCLMRDENGSGAQVVANNISDFQLRYLLDDNTEVDVPPDLGTVRAVRVTLTGQTVATVVASAEAAKIRQATSVISLRNR